ncbi:hypothetical protein BJ508DRAFT_336862 [Ascobolus immersus RN42]|uniref:Uncharacterized protein n=1 Tax=Ascobolus immersus RN42 TaxID=1160509 RepID=A0A3N4HM37_ASCIM|nr:hypothetical protein BJ508DRAFT_336862 [Ascobolus immersus RN42]
MAAPLPPFFAGSNRAPSYNPKPGISPGGTEEPHLSTQPNGLNNLSTPSPPASREGSLIQSSALTAGERNPDDLVDAKQVGRLLFTKENTELLSTGHLSDSEPVIAAHAQAQQHSSAGPYSESSQMDKGSKNIGESCETAFESSGLSPSCQASHSASVGTVSSIPSNIMPVDVTVQNPDPLSQADSQNEPLLHSTTAPTLAAHRSMSSPPRSTTSYSPTSSPPCNKLPIEEVPQVQSSSPEFDASLSPAELELEPKALSNETRTDDGSDSTEQNSQLETQTQPEEAAQDQSVISKRTKPFGGLKASKKPVSKLARRAGLQKQSSIPDTSQAEAEQGTEANPIVIELEVSGRVETYPYAKIRSALHTLIREGTLSQTEFYKDFGILIDQKKHTYKEISFATEAGIVTRAAPTKKRRRNEEHSSKTNAPVTKQDRNRAPVVKRKKLRVQKSAETIESDSDAANDNRLSQHNSKQAPKDLMPKENGKNETMVLPGSNLEVPVPRALLSHSKRLGAQQISAITTYLSSIWEKPKISPEVIEASLRIVLGFGSQSHIQTLWDLAQTVISVPMATFHGLDSVPSLKDAFEAAFQDESLRRMDLSNVINRRLTALRFFDARNRIEQEIRNWKGDGRPEGKPVAFAHNELALRFSPTLSKVRLEGLIKKFIKLYSRGKKLAGYRQLFGEQIVYLLPVFASGGRSVDDILESIGAAGADVPRMLLNCIIGTDWELADVTGIRSFKTLHAALANAIEEPADLPDLLLSRLQDLGLAKKRISAVESPGTETARDTETAKRSISSDYSSFSEMVKAVVDKEVQVEPKDPSEEAEEDTESVGQEARSALEEEMLDDDYGEFDIDMSLHIESVM